MIDKSEVDAWAEQLGDAADKVYDEATKIVAKGALNIKKGAQQRIEGTRYAPDYPRAITYETHRLAAGPAADIGPDKNKRQGALGNILEYGAPEQNTAPKPHIAPAADEELPRFEKALGDLGVALVEGK